MSDDINKYISRIDNILADYNANVSVPVPTNAPEKTKTKTNNKNDKENNSLARLANTRYNTFEKLESLVKRLFILHYTGVYLPPPDSHTCDINSKKRKRGGKKIEKLCKKMPEKTFGSGSIGVSSAKYKPRSCTCCEPQPQQDEDLLLEDILNAPQHTTKINREPPVFIDLTNVTPSTSRFTSNSRKFDTSVICIPDSSDEDSVIDLDSTQNINIKNEDNNIHPVIEIDNLDLETGMNSGTRNFANVDNITDYIDLVTTHYDEDEMRRYEEELIETINQDIEIKTEAPDNVPNVENEELAVRIDQDIEMKTKAPDNVPNVEKEELAVRIDQDQDIEMKTEPPDSVPNFANVENITDYIDLVTTDYDENEMKRYEEELFKTINEDIEIKTGTPDNERNVENKELAVRIDEDIERKTKAPDNVPNVESEELAVRVAQDVEMKTKAPDNVPNVKKEELAVRIDQDQDIEMKTEPPDNVPNFANVENITDYIDLVTTDYDEDEMRRYEEELAETINKTELEILSAAKKNTEENILMKENPANEINASKSASSSRPNLSCPICFEHFDGKEVMSTICGHLFCAECIKEVIKKTKSCPHCRKKLTLKSIHPIYLASIL